MIVISTRDFRANQTKFLDLANKGEDIVLKSRGNGSFRLVPINEQDTILSQQDIMKELQGALRQVSEHLAGKRKLKTLDSLINEL